MTGLDQFLDLFGNITVLNLVQFILAVVFIVIIFKKIKDYLDDKQERMIQEYEKNKERDRKLQIALDAIDQYPKYRQQSIEIQQHLEGEIQALRKSQQENTRRLVEMEETSKRRELNKLRDRLIESYQYYTDPKRNPELCWTRMEAEAFWELFKDYEEDGGNGYIHSVVQPAMNLLRIVEH